ncbi:MAG: NAD-dependent epimerase/dehydratase family protein [Candidatus Omnitrophota bacterium]
MYNYFHNKKVLVTGGTGLIGIPLVKKLDKLGANIRVVSLDLKSPFGSRIEFINGDLCNEKLCTEIVKDMQVVFHLAGIKGGIDVAHAKASTFLIKNILMNIQIMEAARKAAVERFLYASSICIYPPAEVFEEKNALTGLPDSSDIFGGMSKLIGEMQIEAYKLQYNLENFFIVRPTNTYGPYDNFNPHSALVIPALIYRVFNGEDPLTIWGDGSAVRDFVYSQDVADFLILMIIKNTRGPFNVGSGLPLSIKALAEIIVASAEKFIGRKVAIRWDTTRQTGEKHRVASIDKAKFQLGWSPKIDINTGIRKTIEWYYLHKTNLLERYSILSED